MTVAVIDSGGANVGSVLQAFNRAGAEATLTQDRRLIQAASHVVLPGVGTAQAAMATLKSAQLVSVIQALTQPVLGVCLGLQLLFDRSEEGPQPTDTAIDAPTECLGVIPGTVKALEPTPGHRLPHMGWNQLKWRSQPAMARDLTDADWFYFVHSYAVQADHPATVAACHHGQAFAAVVQHNNFVACQFHPEKSARAGAQLIEGFLAT
ncbi:MAG: imidazole glycerol phosphate synthase subunit HisH [Wenzhouxiangella sp.]|nr:imidazole glycerol phosphate synthase subunit HisH [Wenzhouxiangella sp.]